MTMIYLASDHAGATLKNQIRDHLMNNDADITDLGTNGPDSVDYPDFAARLAEAMVTDTDARGILVCGSGIGISIAANRFSHIRAALVTDVTAARLSRQHNDANVLALGERLTGIATALDCVDAFLATDFEGGRHQRRIDKLSSPQPVSS
jgi:ribose 5-phosphate isomerase B